MEEEQIQHTQTNNKRIAKNTLMLYIRMFFIMAISIYTSRVVLQILGVEDFGIYNVVGGVVAMMGILNSAMAVATQRYLTFELGRNDFTRLKTVFNVSLSIYLLLASIIVLLGETVGLWFLNTQLVILPDRMVAANWVYQFSIFSCVISLLYSPYNASILAHEEMSIYAYVSIIESILKLLIVYLLILSPIDKLISYGALLLVVSCCTTFFYYSYCKRKYSECHYSFIHDNKLFREILSYSGWNIFGSAAGLAKNQGTNVLLNMFFTTAVNAACGIAMQVNSVVTQFFTNFFAAVRPQITKYYAQGDMDDMLLLVFRSTKMACYLILLVSLPVIIETPYIIRLWLGFIPEHVVSFVRIIILITMTDSISNPLMTTVHATGRIAFYQFTVGTLNILILPIAYIYMKLGYGPNSVFFVSLVMSVVCFLMRIFIVRWLIHFPVKRYIGAAIVPSLLVTCAVGIVPYYLHVNMLEGGLRFVCVCLTSIVSTIALVYTIGLSRHERKYINTAIKNRLHR